MCMSKNGVIRTSYSKVSAAKFLFCLENTITNESLPGAKGSNIGHFVCSREYNCSKNSF